MTVPLCSEVSFFSQINKVKKNLSLLADQKVIGLINLAEKLTETSERNGTMMTLQ